MVTTLNIVICTHNRRSLLERVLKSIADAAAPRELNLKILIVANACTDDTVAFLDNITANSTADFPYTVNYLVEPQAGKSHALNLALSNIEDGYIAFVDDDHRIDHHYLESIERHISNAPQDNIVCGRILPDWTGAEPGWVHDTGPYMIYPLPVPKFDLGQDPHRLTDDSPIPGGGNLVIKKSVFDAVGLFSTRLGPKGHDLGGSEDTDLLERAGKLGYTIEYSPEIVQHHYVDEDRLKFRYLLQKSFQRNKTITLARGAAEYLPRYLVRKLLYYLASAIFCIRWDKRRFFLVRGAGTFGEIIAHLNPAVTHVRPSFWEKMTVVGAIVVLLLCGGLPALGFGFALAAFLTAKSVIAFTRSGPQVRDEVLSNFRMYAAWCVVRLALFCVVIAGGLAAVGIGTLEVVADIFKFEPNLVARLAAGTSAICLVAAVQFCHQLLHIPSSICASAQFRLSRMYPIWNLLSPARLRAVTHLLLIVVFVTLLSGAVIALYRENLAGAAYSGLLIVTLALLIPWFRDAAPKANAGQSIEQRERSRLPNVVMIGADTLRADRLGILGDPNNLTPYIDSLARRGTLFSNCYVPLGRTAPSLLSLFSGKWPHSYGVRDNFVSDSETKLSAQLLPEILRQHGYDSHVISDWSGADFRKFPFGFDSVDVPSDQWNLKYYLRQGPLDLRLFISLFTHNQFGKAFLPELFYLAGVPLTNHLCGQARDALELLAKNPNPFFLNVFMGTTHAPYGSEYPYYCKYSDNDYNGPSKFVMAKFADPMEIVEAQEAERSRFDVDQILKLYNGCVNRFDDAVRYVVESIREMGLDDNTIIVIYSDHGTDFFENHTWGQGNTIVGSDPSAKIPLLIVDPRHKSSSIVDNVVRTVDLVPTLVDLLDLETAIEFDGSTLAPVIEASGEIAELPAFQETGLWLGRVPGMHKDHITYPMLLDLLEVEDKDTGTLSISRNYRDLFIKAKDRMIRRGKWKMTYFPLSTGPLYQLFDIERDPLCHRNVIDEFPDIAEPLKTELTDWILQDPLLRDEDPEKMNSDAGSLENVYEP